jgi:hypothetical protein
VEDGAVDLSAVVSIGRWRRIVAVACLSLGTLARCSGSCADCGAGDGNAHRAERNAFRRFVFCTGLRSTKLTWVTSRTRKPKLISAPALFARDDEIWRDPDRLFGLELQALAGAFLSKGVPVKRWFEHYAATFSTVELNTSFYRLPTPETFEKWRDQAPPGSPMPSRRRASSLT